MVWSENRPVFYSDYVELELDSGIDSIQYTIFMLEYTHNNRENRTSMQSFGLIVANRIKQKVFDSPMYHYNRVRGLRAFIDNIVANVLCRLHRENMLVGRAP